MNADKIKLPETWEIKLLTSNGIKTETFKPIEKSIPQFEKEMFNKYGTFIMQSSKLIYNNQNQ